MIRGQSNNNILLSKGSSASTCSGTKKRNPPKSCAYHAMVLDTFPQFQSLPRELRDAVWDFALFDAYRNESFCGKVGFDKIYLTPKGGSLYCYEIQVEMPIHSTEIRNIFYATHNKNRGFDSQESNDQGSDCQGSGGLGSDQPRNELENKPKLCDNFWNLCKESRDAERRNWRAFGRKYQSFRHQALQSAVLQDVNRIWIPWNPWDPAAGRSMDDEVRMTLWTLFLTPTMSVEEAVCELEEKVRNICSHPVTSWCETLWIRSEEVAKMDIAEGLS
ncbi:hypothetical protein GE09DRAFT_634036 [Coniochaeta sp. 2T2.1]|nr:hypothetical protein GE09DRAFT_634036 [Coniochaeta sp. 2T2.1]